MLRILRETKSSVTLTHRDERRDCPGRYSGLASGPIVAFIAASLCSLTDDAGILIRPSRVSSGLISALAEREEPWLEYKPGLERSSSFYVISDAVPALFPNSKEDLDDVIEMIYPDWTATVMVFSGYSSLFRSAREERTVVQHAETEELFRIEGGVDQFVVNMRNLGLDLAEIVRALMSEMNRFLN